ncbi:MAG: hypothetical protein JRJ29_20935 [Deltaproteobacteria bacterium]|nr:hypothetical protein [Deltaproteobacteria bacterium]
MPVILFPQFNDPEWYQQMEKIQIDRTCMLAIMGALEFALYHWDCKVNTRRVLRTIGRMMGQRLLDYGLRLSTERKQAWAKLFDLRF